MQEDRRLTLIVVVAIGNHQRIPGRHRHGVAAVTREFVDTLHLDQTGGHGFGALKQGTTSDLFLEQFLLWIKANGFLQPKAP